MNTHFLFVAITVISIFSGLFVEGIKKLLDEGSIKFSSNILAVIVSFVLSILSSIMYIVYNNIVVTPQVVIEVIIVCALTFLTSTCGYDKVVQAIEQIKQIKK